MRLILFMIGLGVFFLVGWMLFGEGIEETWDLKRLAEHFEAAKGWAWLAGIGLLMADLLFPIPGTVVMSALGAVYGFWWGGVFAVVGSMAGGLLGYGIGRFCDERSAKRWLGEKDFEKGRGVFARRGAWVIAMTRALPILPEVIVCMAGLVRMPFQRFLLALSCGSLPMGFLFAWIGTLGREEPGWAIGFSLLAPAVLWSVAALFRKV